MMCETLSQNNLLHTKRFAEQHKRNGDGDRFASGGHGGGQRGATRSNERQYKLNAQIAG